MLVGGRWCTWALRSRVYFALTTVCFSVDCRPQVNGYLCKSPLRKAELKHLAKNMGETLSSPQAFIKVRFLSRGTAVAALVKGYPVLLAFLKEQGGLTLVNATNKRVTAELNALEERAQQARGMCGVFLQTKTGIMASTQALLNQFGPNPSVVQQEQMNHIIMAAQPGKSTSAHVKSWCNRGFGFLFVRLSPSPRICLLYARSPQGARCKC